MLCTERTISKLKKVCRAYHDYIYEKISDISLEFCETEKHFRGEPGRDSGLEWRSASPGLKWGGEGVTAWFRGRISLPSEVSGREIFLSADTGGDTLIFCNGKPCGVFDRNHFFVRIAPKAESGKKFHIALETYSGHSFPGFSAGDREVPVKEKSREFKSAAIFCEREDVKAFVFDLEVLLQLAEVLDPDTLRRAEIVRELCRVYSVMCADPESSPEEIWRPSLKKARSIMKPLLEKKNGPTAPQFGLVNHSHIDTAWIWNIREGWRKCARTFSFVLNLMGRYPEARFIQSSPYHALKMKELYPDIFEGISRAVEKNRWEPNGAMFVEADTNLPSGESLVRQFIFGRRATEDMFGYKGDVLWLPDVFGYSAALPQIMKGCGVDFFCTTKLDWNDTTKFPCDTFHWKGIDGSSVIAHFNFIQTWADPRSLVQRWKEVQHKDVQDRRLCAMGHGDGGGGPMMEMVEIARRVEDLEGCPRVRNTTVSDFMKGIRDDLGDSLPEWFGELYVEKHRGTYTTMGRLKHLNRRAELALRDAEYLGVMAALHGKCDYPHNQIRQIWQTLLIRQFHDILPGTSIPEVNREAQMALEGCIREAEEISEGFLDKFLGKSEQSGNYLAVVNTLGWNRPGELVVENFPRGSTVEGDEITTQEFRSVNGDYRVALYGVGLPGFGSISLPLDKANKSKQESAFKITDNRVETPFLNCVLNQNGEIVSLKDTECGRELVKEKGFLNRFLIGEDYPLEWDNWDIDMDQSSRMNPGGKLVKKEIISDGPLQLRIQMEYEIGLNSKLNQHIVFHSTTPRIDFETQLEWREDRRLLKVRFDLDILAPDARHEIQFGHLRRPMHRNRPDDRAAFEVCAHKWTDISEHGYGVAILNNGKYGVTAKSDDISLTLVKCGTHPDKVSEKGKQFFTYSLLPHSGGFSAENVIYPAYVLNIPVLSRVTKERPEEIPPVVRIHPPNVVAETVKWAENEKGWILRMYESEGTGTNVGIQFTKQPRSAAFVNMLEEDNDELSMKKGIVSFYIRPFEIKTLLCRI